MKEEVSGMGRPNSRAELCAWVLGLMGAFFLLFGGAVLLWGEPQEGAEVLVWLDPDRPGRAFVDPDSVRLDLMG